MFADHLMRRFLVRVFMNKRYLIPRVLICCLFLIFLYSYGLNKIEANFMFKIYMKNSSQRACKFPQLFVDDPLIKKYFQEEKRLECREEKNWIYTDNGYFYIDSKAKENHGEIACDMFRIERHNDDDHIAYKHVGVVLNNTPLMADMFKVKCKAEDNSTYQNLHVGVPLPENDPRKPNDKLENATSAGLKLNVLIYIFDSVSRMHFIRKLPKFYQFLIEEFKGFMFEGFNIVGDSTTAAVIPMLTGYFQTELPEARKRHENASHLDDWPLVFKEYMAQDYVTSHLEEQAWTNAFHLRLKGFKNPPVNKHMRPLLIAWEREKHRQLPFCMGDTPMPIVWLEYFRQLQRVYRPRNRPHFSFMHTSELSHDFYNKVQVLDEHLVENFGALLKGDYFNDTLVFVMSDHGHRHVTTRATQSGKWEERLPFLFIRPPPWFCVKYPTICQNMHKNKDALVTAFDLHATLRHVLQLGASEERGQLDEGGLDEREISLFRKIPDDRSCGHAAISAHFCSCLEWVEINDPNNDQLVLGAAQHVVDYFNEKTTKDLPGACANLTVGKIVSASHLKPNDKLLAFKESFDYDQFFPDLSDNSSIAAVIYQVKFVTEPGPGLWEVSVTYFTQLRKYVMVMDNVSRINVYGNQARCVLEESPHLRTFCYCLHDKAPTDKKV